MSRKSLGIVAAALLLLGVVIAFRGPADGSGAPFAGGCIRVGLVLAALWLAFPQLAAGIKRLPGWAVGWLVGGKPAAKGDSQDTAARQQIDEPPPRVKRPRRRSQA